MQEEFKDVEGYEGLYQISNLGNLKSLSRQVCNSSGCRITKEKILCKRINKAGYFQIGLFKDLKSKTFTMHQLVAMAFLNHNKSNGLIIDHINNNSLDNRLQNLQLITQRENLSKDKKGSSKYTGVGWYNRLNKWSSTISINRKSYHLGLFNTELEASEIYQKSLKEFETLNILPKSLKSSKYYGVSFNKNVNKWTARLSNKGGLFLGYFQTELEAYDATLKYL